jgi:hypothetical protein
MSYGFPAGAAAFEPEPARISGRLRNALVADLTDEEADLVEVDRLLTESMGERDWTEHLGRQLGFRTMHSVGDVHATLMVLIPELDRLLRNWPLPEDGKAVGVLALAATKSLPPLEAYATLLDGPGGWHASLHFDSSFEGLGACFREALERGLRASLNDMFGRWTRWNIPKMRERWLEAKKRQAEEVSEVDLIERRRTAEQRRQRLQETKEERAKWRTAASFQAPGRTY